MPSFRHGKLTVLLIGSTGAPGTITNDISNTLNNISFPRPVDTAETTAFTNTNKSYVAGLPNATLSASGMYDAATDAILNPMLGFDTPLGWKFGPEGNASTRVQYTQAGTTIGILMTAYNVTNPVANMVGYQADFIVSGAVTRTTWP